MTDLRPPQRPATDPGRPGQRAPRRGRLQGKQRMLQIARVRGVPVLVSPSWLIIGVLLTVIYGPAIRDAVPGIGSVTAYLTALGFAVLFALCILAHEIGHTMVSTALGYPVQRVVLFLLGGVSEIEGEPRRARDELLISAAGPLVSVVVSAACFGGYALAPSSSLIEVLLALLAYSNAVLAVFNLLPGLPLDGGRLLRAAVWGLGAQSSTGTRIAGWSGRVLAVGVAVTGLIVDRTSAGLTAGLVSLVLAGYLWSAASESLRVADVQRRLPAIQVADLLRPGLLLPADVTVAAMLERVWSGHALGVVLTDPYDRPTAIVDETLIAGVPEQRRPWTPASEVARRLEPGLVLPVDIDASELLDRMQQTPAREYLMVSQDGAPAGIIATVDFARRLRGRGRPHPAVAT